MGQLSPSPTKRSNPANLRGLFISRVIGRLLRTRRLHQNHSATVEDDAVTDTADGLEGYAPAAGIHINHRHFGIHAVANSHRGEESESLAQIDCARPRKLICDYGGQQTRRKHPVHDPPMERCPARVGFIQVNGIVIA
jgi:hypothetical protein